ncbi:hypothetical protein RugamoR57_49330 [Duganella caerulea]|uniref:hypothetical protein n=1 Tax=Duganella caerulea TaxID=2885762 RepID=UPI0030E90987
MTSQKFTYPTEKIINSAFLKNGRSDVVKWEALPIPEACSLKLIFENWDKSKRHGVWVGVEGELVVNGFNSASMEIWSDSAPETVLIEVKKSNGIIHLYNIWDSGKGKQSQSYTSGMLIEEIVNGRRYRCNDIGFEEKFDHLTFQILWD